MRERLQDGFRTDREMTDTSATSGEDRIPELQNGDAGRAEIDDLRRLDGRRKKSLYKPAQCHDLRICCIEARSRLKINLYHGHAVVAGRFNVLDVIDKCRQTLLVRRC